MNKMSRNLIPYAFQTCKYSPSFSFTITDIFFDHALSRSCGKGISVQECITSVTVKNNLRVVARTVTDKPRHCPSYLNFVAFVVYYHNKQSKYIAREFNSENCLSHIFVLGTALTPKSSYIN